MTATPAMPSIYRTPEGERAVMALYDSLLAHWAAPYETRQVPTRHGEAFVIACGEPSAPPLVLLHGAGTNSAIWAGDVADYTRHYRVYAVDLPGEPGRSAQVRPAWDGPAFAEWLADVLDGLGLDRAALVGISQGAWTALKFAVSQPERVEKLALICPGGVVPDRASFIVKAVAYSLLGRWGMRRMTRLLYGSQTVPDGVEAVMGVVTRHFKARVGTLPIFSDDDLRRLTMPVFLLGGTQDALRDLEAIAARLRRLVPDLTVTILPGAGHAVLNSSGPVLAFLIGEVA